MIKELQKLIELYNIPRVKNSRGLIVIQGGEYKASFQEQRAKPLIISKFLKHDLVQVFVKNSSSNICFNVHIDHIKYFHDKDSLVSIKDRIERGVIKKQESKDV